MEPKKNVHHCFNCSEETDDYEEMPNGRKVWCCGSSACEKELRSELRGMEQEARYRAENDGYSQYY